MWIATSLYCWLSQFSQHIKSFKHLLHRKKEIELVEQFNEKLLIKQRGENLVIYDVRTGSLLEVPRTEFTTPSAFIFLHESQLFLTFCKNKIAVWNFSGQIVTRSYSPFAEGDVATEI